MRYQQTINYASAPSLNRLGKLWRERLRWGWEPPEDTAEETPFPWEQVRRSLAALLPDLINVHEWLAHVRPETSGRRGTVALLLAGNTPLLGWPALVAALLAEHTLRVRMSRHETLWPRLFMESLAIVDAKLAKRITLNTWPPGDGRTADLLRSANAFIAYGGDQTLADLRLLVPDGIPFFGFGHAISVGLVLPNAYLPAAAEGFALDTLMYGQQGCLSPQTIFVVGDGNAANRFAAHLPDALRRAAGMLAIPSVEDAAVAHAVRTARDLALFDGATVQGNDALVWTTITYPNERDLPPSVGQGVLSVVPLARVEDLPARLGALAGKVSCIGVAGELSPAELQLPGVSRVCLAGTMQTPPLTWSNGNIDLLHELTRL